MEVNVVARHIDHDGGVIGDIDEFEIDATIAGGGKLLTGEREHLRGGLVITGEGDELLVISYAFRIDGSGASVIGELEADGILRFIVVVFVAGGSAFRRRFESLTAPVTCSLDKGSESLDLR